MSTSNIDLNSLVKYSDVLASGTGAFWGYTFNNTKQPGMYALQAGVISVLARLIREQVLMDKLSSLTPSGKDELVVGVLNALYAYSMKRPVLKSMISGISIDLLAEQIMQMLSIQDQGLFAGASS